jgi:hypothetical protein
MAQQQQNAQEPRVNPLAQATHLADYVDLLSETARCEGDTIAKISRIIAKFVRDNDQWGAQNDQYNPHASHFYIASPANLTIEQYFVRLQKYFHCSNECFILAFIYIDRAVTMNKNALSLCSRNIHRLILAALTLATKFYDDIYYSNTHYAKVGGVSTREIDNLEYQLLCLVNWKLFVAPDEYSGYMHMIHSSPL